ncbi:MAG: hypothetical protein ACI857_001513 [Arenicella sp.]|jgi:hypothetical protein
MKILYFFFMTMLCLSGYSQKIKEDKIPKKIQKSIPDLSAYLSNRPRETKDKVEAIYEWVTENIKYDYERLAKSAYFTGVDPEKILKTKNAICNGYVELMKSMLDEIGVRNQTVEGYVRDEYWAPGKLTVMESHAWLAMEIDGEWYLADPTWDAGYIGRMPKNIKPYETKKYLKNSWKNKIKEEKIKLNREKSEKERKIKYDEKPKSKDQIGFVPYPTKNHFMIPADSFLLTHLPINPMWQLRDDYLSINDFSKGEDSILLRLGHNEGKHINYNSEIDNYMNQDFLQQLIVLGETGHEFNPFNPSIKALKYYNFMSLVHNKQLQKLARGSRYEINSSKKQELYALNDTIIKFNKQFKKAEKTIYKDIKTIDKARYKSTSVLTKENLKRAKKIESEQKKLLEFIKKSNDNIDKNFESIEKTREKIDDKYPGAFGYTTSSYVKKDIVKVWEDSVNMQIDSLKKIKEDFQALRSKTNFNELFSDVEFGRSLVIYQIEMVKENNYLIDDRILEIDTLLRIATAHSVMLFADSLRMELMSKKTMGALKNINNYVRKSRTDFKAKQTNNEISETEVYDEFMQAKVLEALLLVEEINNQSMNFNRSVTEVLKPYRSTRELTGLLEDLIELKEEKYDYISEYVDADHDRNIRLINLLDEHSREWKQLYAPEK